MGRESRICYIYNVELVELVELKTDVQGSRQCLIFFKIIQVIAFEIMAKNYSYVLEY